jgi:hypothetical protein
MRRTTLLLQHRVLPERNILLSEIRVQNRSVILSEKLVVF